MFLDGFLTAVLSLSWSDKAGVDVLLAPPKSTVVAPRLIVVGAGGCLVDAGGCLMSAGDGVVYTGVVVVDAGCRSISIVAVAAGEVSIYYPLMKA